MITQTSGNGVGKVFLVGAGPGDPTLITVRGAQCLAQADLVLYDYLINPELLRYAPESCERTCVGHPHNGYARLQEDVNQQMITAARAGRTVVRLKSGDPHIFGRGAEEVAALVAAEVPFEVVPGVTAASAVAFITGHRRADHNGAELDYTALAQFPGTLVFYMGITTSPQWSQSLLRGGRSPDTPVAIVRRASWPDQETVYCTLGTLADVIQQREIRPPAVIVVGEVVGLTTRKTPD